MYNKLLTRPFLKSAPYQIPTINILHSALINCYNNVPYSTFPYIFNQVNSHKSLKYFSSGSSVAMCYNIKYYLKQNNIKSYLIPATLPDNLKYPEYLTIAHTAIAVPSHNNIIWILDPGLYLIHPIKIIIPQASHHQTTHQTTHHQTTHQTTERYNIFNNNIELVDYFTEYVSNQQKLNKYQQLPKQTYNIIFTSKESIWKYYLREIINPDKAITSFLINTQISRKPQIIIINRLQNSIQCELMINITANTILIKYYNKVIYNNKIANLSNKLIHHLSKRLNPYFNNRFIYYLDTNHIIPDTIIF